MIAINAAAAFAEYFGEEGGEGVLLCDFEAMSDVWNVLAELAGQAIQISSEKKQKEFFDGNRCLVDKNDFGWL